MDTTLIFVGAQLCKLHLPCAQGEQQFAPTCSPCIGMAFITQ